MSEHESPPSVRAIPPSARPILLGTTDAATFLGVHPDTLKRYPIPYRRLGPKGRRRYALEDLRAFLASIEVHETPEPAP